jgi:hypothetical protein
VEVTFAHEGNRPAIGRQHGFIFLKEKGRWYKASASQRPVRMSFFTHVITQRAFGNDNSNVFHVTGQGGRAMDLKRVMRVMLVLSFCRFSVCPGGTSRGERGF